MASLILASGFFSSSETAFFYLSRDQIRNFRTGNSRQRMVASLLSDPDRLLTAVLFWNLVINLAYFSVSVVIAHRLSRAGLTAAAGAYGLLSLFAMILFGEVGPKSLAVAFRNRLAPLVSWPLAAAVRTLDPIVPTLGRVTRALRRAFWPGIKREPYLRSEDLETAVEHTHSGARILQQEREVLHNILDLSEISVEEVMRPRGMYVSANGQVAIGDLGGEVPPSDYLILCDEQSEDVSGAVPLTNFTLVPVERLEAAGEDVVQVPWCATAAHALQLMRDEFCSVAAVVNEYGETIGVATYEDIIDTVVLPQPSRAKRLLRRDPVLEVAPGRFHVDGITTLRYLSQRVGIDADLDSDDRITVTGLLHDELERIPAIGDECTWYGFVFRVIEINARGMLRAMIFAQHEDQTQPEADKA